MPGTVTECRPTGYEPMDREHGALVTRLGRLLSAVSVGDRARATEAFAEFARACAEHFAHEEQLMAEAAFGQAAQHKAAHDLYLANLAELAADLGTLGITPELRRGIGGRAVEWFRFHVSVNDAALGAFLVSRNRAAKAADAKTAPLTRTAGARR